MNTEERGPPEEPLGSRPPESAFAQQEGQREVASEHAAASETVPLPILATKLHRPPVAPDILPRARLLEQLNEGRQRPLTLVSAPAGYGKSTLASRWLEACDGPGIWVSLDEDDNDLRSFLAYFLAAYKRRFPILAIRPGPCWMPPTCLLDRFWHAYLLNDLDQIDEPFILVLDDYHHIHETAVHDAAGRIAGPSAADDASRSADSARSALADQHSPGAWANDGDCRRAVAIHGCGDGGFSTENPQAVRGARPRLLPWRKRPKDG